MTSLTQSHDLEPETQAEEIWREFEDPLVQRDVLNPFDGCPWDVYFNRLTEGYMDAERDTHRPIGDVHKHWAEKFNSDGNIGILAHRDALKTTFTLGYLIACLEYNEGFRAHWITNTQGQAHKKAHAELLKFIERNPWLVNLNNPTQNNKESKEFQNGSMLYSGWLFGAIEGDRSHLLILDDVIKERGDGGTDQVIQWIEGVTVPMVKDSGETAIIGTRKRPDDIYSRLIGRDAYDFTEYPAILDVWDQEFREDDNWADRRPPESLYTEVPNTFDDPGTTIHVLWPEARGADYLARKKSQMSPHLFWREYCMVIRGASGNLIDQQDINRLVDDGGCSIRNQAPPREYAPSSGEMVIVGHDPAQSPTGDKAAFVTQLIQADGTRRILDAQANQGMSPSSIRATLLDLNDRYDPAKIVIEDNGMQQYIVNDAISLTPDMKAKVTGMSTTGKKHSWENGIPRLRTLVENGNLQLYRGDDGVEDFVQAALSLDLSDGKLQGHTPDLIAAWFMAEKGEAKTQTQTRDRGVRTF